MADGSGSGGDRDRRRRPTAIYSAIVGLAFIAIIAVAAVNMLETEDSGVLGAAEEGDLPLAQFAVPDLRSDLEGDANIAQDDCEAGGVPCPGSRQTSGAGAAVTGAITRAARPGTSGPADSGTRSPSASRRRARRSSR